MECENPSVLGWKWYFDIISGFHRDTDSFNFLFFSLHSPICKRNTLQLSRNKIISLCFLRKCFFAGDSCLYVSAALTFENNASAVRPY